MTTVISHTDGKRILVRFPFDRSMVDKVRTVPGARWNATHKEWRLPLTMDTCRFLRRVFGSDLKVSTALAAWAKGEIDKALRLENLRHGYTGEEESWLEKVAEEAPDLFAAMRNRPYQLNGTAFMAEAKQCILGDDPGLGKTLQTLGALLQNNARTILVACRRTATRTVWERETLRWCPTIEPYVAQGSPKERQRVIEEFAASDAPRRMLIINIEMVRAKRVVVCPNGLGDMCQTSGCRHSYSAEYNWPSLFGMTWDAIVFDESHNLLASTANYQSKRITQARYGAYCLRKQLKPDGLAIALSGTPFRSKLTKGWGTLNWCRPDVFGSYWRWAETHFGVERGVYGKVVGGGEKSPRPVDEAAWDAMLRPYYLKRDKTTAAPDLPPIAYAGTPIDSGDESSPKYVQIDMDPQQAKAYRQMALDASATLANGRILATGVLAEITRLRQFADAYGSLGDAQEVIPTLPSSKLDWLAEFMQEREDTGARVVVASSFSKMVELAAEVLRKEGFKVLTLTGATKDQARTDLVARFADPDDEVQVICLNSSAGGESITLDTADEMVFLDMPWTSDEARQVEARIHRVSRVHQVTVYRLASVGTVDTWIAGMSEEQRQTILNADPKEISRVIGDAQ